MPVGIHLFPTFPPLVSSLVQAGTRWGRTSLHLVMSWVPGRGGSPGTWGWVWELPPGACWAGDLAPPADVGCVMGRACGCP